MGKIIKKINDNEPPSTEIQRLTKPYIKKEKKRLKEKYLVLTDNESTACVPWDPGTPCVPWDPGTSIDMSSK